MDPSILATSVLSKRPESPLTKVSSQLKDRQVLTGKDLSLTSYANHPDVYGVEIRKGAGDTLYEYPIFIKDSPSALKWQTEMKQQPSGDVKSKTTGMVYNVSGDMFGGPRKSASGKSMGGSKTEQTSNPQNSTENQRNQWGDFSNVQGTQNANMQFASGQDGAPAEDEASWGDIAAEAGLLWGNIASMATSTVPVYGTAASGVLGASTDIGQFAKNISDDGYQTSDLSQLGLDLAATGVGLIPFGAGASAKFALKAPILAQKAIKLASRAIKGLSFVVNTGSAGEQGYNALRELQQATLMLQKDPTDMKAYERIVGAVNDAAKGVRSWKGRKGDQTTLATPGTKGLPSPSGNATGNKFFGNIPMQKNGGKIKSRYV